MKIAIVTDSSTGISLSEAKELGIYMVSMPLLINDEQLLEDISITQEEFYKKLEADASVATSQPNPYEIQELWDSILKTHDAIVHIPLSSGLSETCNSLTKIAEESYKGKVYVVNNQRVSITMKKSVMDALKMRDAGMSAEEIYTWLTDTKMQSSIYIMVATLKYLKKGGRLTPAAAAIGTLLKIKPVLQIQGGKLDQYAKVRKISEAKNVMMDAIKNDFEGRFKDIVAAGKMTLHIAHTQNEEAANAFAEEFRALYPNVPVEYVDPLSLVISCHIGPGCLAVGCSISY